MEWWRIINYSMISAQQQTAIDHALQGHNVFITGGAGVGKSFLTSSIVDTLRGRGNSVKVSASTGTAAALVNGQTLHSLLGLGLAKDPVEVLISRATRNRKILKTWRSIDTLVVDEISMLHPTFFTKLARVVSAVRDCALPFGGIQVILVGDFFQLPPVPERGQPATDPKFIFETDAWTQLDLKHVELTQIFRQEDDGAFAQTLRRIRKGQVEDQDVELLFERLHADIDHAEGVVPTQLYSRRDVVDRLNGEHMAKLDTPSVNCEYSLQYSLAPGVNESDKHVKDEMQKFVKEVRTNMRAAESLELKVGAQVMMSVNRPDMGLVNGSRGVVLKFVGDVPVVRFAHTTTMVSPHTWKHTREFLGEVLISQIPLQHAWALTIHKAQGVSLDCAEISLDRSVFEFGQAYVALSRLRTVDGLKLVSFKMNVIRADPRVVAFYDLLNA
jgi:ATP-dependent exoDNAse (exonuclease V) alpha subunit